MGRHRQGQARVLVVEVLLERAGVREVRRGALQHRDDLPHLERALPVVRAHQARHGEDVHRVVLLQHLYRGVDQRQRLVVRDGIGGAVALDQLLLLGELREPAHELGGDGALAQLAHAAQHDVVPDLAADDGPVDPRTVQVRHVDLRDKAADQHLLGLDVDLRQHLLQGVVLSLGRREDQAVGRQVGHDRRGVLALLVRLEHRRGGQDLAQLLGRRLRVDVLQLVDVKVARLGVHVQLLDDRRGAGDGPPVPDDDDLPAHGVRHRGEPLERAARLGDGVELRGHRRRVPELQGEGPAHPRAGGGVQLAQEVHALVDIRRPPLQHHIAPVAHGQDHDGLGKCLLERLDDRLHGHVVQWEDVGHRLLSVPRAALAALHVG